jgi:curved DNA-binding protein
MLRPGQTLTPDRARSLLGLSVHSSPHDILPAFRKAAKRVHPDVPGGDTEQFRDILEAYRLLQTGARSAPTATLPPAELTLTITPAQALGGGETESALLDGRRVRISLPPGLRESERLRVAGQVFRISVGQDGDTQVRGDDVWTTARVPEHVLARGGRLAIETAVGRRIIWVTRKAAQRGLVRLEGQGLPARDWRPQGSMFLRLVPDDAPTVSEARQLLRRFAAAWAA